MKLDTAVEVKQEVEGAITLVASKLGMFQPWYDSLYEMKVAMDETKKKGKSSLKYKVAKMGQDLKKGGFPEVVAKRFALFAIDDQTQPHVYNVITPPETPCIPEDIALLFANKTNPTAQVIAN